MQPITMLHQRALRPRSTLAQNAGARVAPQVPAFKLDDYINRALTPGGQVTVDGGASSQSPRATLRLEWVTNRLRGRSQLLILPVSAAHHVFETGR